MPEELDVVFEAALQKALNFLSERGFNRELRQEQKSSVKQLFTGGLFMTAVDRIKCRYAHSGMTSGVGGFQNSGVCLQAFPPFLPPLPPSPLTRAIFRAVFAPKQHGNACFAGVCELRMIAIPRSVYMVRNHWST